MTMVETVVTRRPDGGIRVIERPPGWRRIEVEAFCDYARDAAKVLVLMGAADEVYPSFLIPGQAVWSLNGEPQLPPGQASLNEERDG